MCLAPSQFAFNPSSIFYIMTCRKPLNDASQFVAQRYRAYQEPAILCVSPLHAKLCLERLAGGHSREPLGHYPWLIFRMNYDRPAPVPKILQRETVVVQPAFINVISGTVRKSCSNHCRNCVDNKFEVSFGFLSILDVGPRAIPPNELAPFIAQRVETN